MKYILVVIALICLSWNLNAQDLIMSNDNILTTDWRRLYGTRDKDGTWMANQRFIKRNDSFFIEIKAYERFGEQVISKEGDNMQFHFQMHKGTITAKCTKSTTTWHKYNAISSKESSFTFLEYHLLPRQVDSIIQNKVRNINISAKHPIAAEIENEWNYDLRSAAAAIISGRDIRDNKIKIKYSSKPSQ